jgi:hypothetical protein
MAEAGKFLAVGVLLSEQFLFSDFHGQLVEALELKVWLHLQKTGCQDWVLLNVLSCLVQHLL